MANSLNHSFGKQLLDGDRDLVNETVKVSLMDDTIAFTPSTQDYYDDVQSAAQEVATLASKTTATRGVYDAADPTFSAADGDPCEWAQVWVDTAGAASTDALVAGYDVFSSGMPVTPNGGDIDFEIHADGLFALIPS